jgi:hypothetical protein
MPPAVLCFVFQTGSHWLCQDWPPTHNPPASQVARITGLCYHAQPTLKISLFPQPVWVHFRCLVSLVAFAVSKGTERDQSERHPGVLRALRWVQASCCFLKEFAPMAMCLPSLIFRLQHSHGAFCVGYSFPPLFVSESL